MDYNLVVKPSALLNFLQDMASEGAEKQGFGYSYISKHNLPWFLLKYRMEFDAYPAQEDDLHILTEARGYNKLFALRDFEIYSASGQLLGRIASQWALVDLENKAMIPPGNVFDFMPKFEKREDDLSYQKIKPVERVDFSKEFQIRFDDIDVNKHVNNANYIIWAMEALPYEFKSAHKMKTVDMIYKKEIAFGSNVISEVEFDNETLTSLHAVKNKETGEELCLVKAVFE
jgi:medium-chain acyl-[acyl-carrier-protein] hydrolase